MLHTRALFCVRATRSSVSGVSMATTKIYSTKYSPDLNWFICISFLGMAWLGLAGARHDSVDTPSSFSFWFFPIAEGLGEGSCQGNRHL